MHVPGKKFCRTGWVVDTETTVARGLDRLKKTAGAAAVKHPYGWPAEGLDIEATKDLGYRGYKGTSPFSGEAGLLCASATFGAVVGQLQERVADDPAHPYHGIPLSMMQCPSDGVTDFASLCGAVNGACMVIGLVCGGSRAKMHIADLLKWYSETALPIYPSPKYGTPHRQSVAGSCLCHVSVSKWCLISGCASHSSERSDRCACLCADVASRVVEILNSGLGGMSRTACGNSVLRGQCHFRESDSSDRFIGHAGHAEISDDSPRDQRHRKITCQKSIQWQQTLVAREMNGWVCRETKGP